MNIKKALISKDGVILQMFIMEKFTHLEAEIIQISMT